MLSLRVSRDKRGYDYIYLLLEARRRGRVENRLLYCGRWPTPCRVGAPPFDDETRARLEDAHPDVAFDWPTLLKTLQAALGVSRPAPPGGPPPPPSQRSRRPDRSDRPGAGAMPPSAYGGRPGQPRRPGGPSAPRPSEPMPIEALARESEAADYPSAEVVLVSADLEERESPYVAPEFEAVHDVTQSFAASFEVELASEGTVEIPVPESTEPPTVSVGGHTFAPPTAEAVSEGEAAAEGDDEGEFDDDSDEADDVAAASDTASDTAPAAEVGTPGGAAVDPNRPRRRRRRRGGRGRGKPPETRQSSE